jgi:hypothetical protein
MVSAAEWISESRTARSTDSLRLSIPNPRATRDFGSGACCRDELPIRTNGKRITVPYEVATTPGNCLKAEIRQPPILPPRSVFGQQIVRLPEPGLVQHCRGAAAERGDPLPQGSRKMRQHAHRLCHSPDLRARSGDDQLHDRGPDRPAVLDHGPQCAFVSCEPLSVVPMCPSQLAG